MGYTIKQVSQLTGLSISTLRYYDREGQLPELRRLEARLAAVQAALEHSQSTLEFYEIAVSVGSVTVAEELYSGEKFLQQREEGGLIPLEKESDSESSEVALPHDDLPRSASRSDNTSSMSLSIQTD